MARKQSEEGAQPTAVLLAFWSTAQAAQPPNASTTPSPIRGGPEPSRPPLPHRLVVHYPAVLIPDARRPPAHPPVSATR